MPDLFDHQREGIEWLQSRTHSILADEPGLGKSAQQLLAAVEPVLVIAPAMILDSGTWDDEIARWTPGIDATQVAYSGLTERERTAKGGTRPTDRLRPEYRGEWGTVIADEAHYLKGRDTHWTKATEKLRTPRFRQLTGTPIVNWAHEAFMCLRLTYPEQAKPGGRFGSYWRWVGEWFELNETKWSKYDIGDLRPDRTWDGFVAANWGEGDDCRFLRRFRDDCLDLPPMTLQEFRVRMVPAQAKAYRELKRDFVTWLEDRVEVASWNTASQITRLMQCSTGLEVLDPASGVRGSAKLDALRSLLADRDRPTLVVGHFRATANAAAAVARETGKEAVVVDGGTSKRYRRDYVRAFQSGSVDILCATIDVISEGVTLTAADQIIRIERSWRPDRNEQTIRRIHRIGQERPVSVVDLITEGTADERVLEMLAKKTDQQMKALPAAALKGIL